jgi:hypothetical protein
MCRTTDSSWPNAGSEKKKTRRRRRKKKKKKKKEKEKEKKLCVLDVCFVFVELQTTKPDQKEEIVEKRKSRHL